MFFIQLALTIISNIEFDLYGMNPLKIKILLTHNFDFNEFLGYGGGAFYCIKPFCFNDHFVPCCFTK